MSAGEYTLNIKIKDPQNLFAQIKNLEQNGIGSKVNAASGGGSIWTKKLGDLNLGMLAKLTGIGFGIHQLVQLGIKSSGILQGTMKMWESSIMLMIKPIADFIGLMLRPVTVLMLTQFIIPFYKYVYPWFRDAGKAAGGELAKGFFPTETGHTPPFDLRPAFENAGTTLGQFFTDIGTKFQIFGAQLGVKLAGIPDTLFNVFVNIGTTLWTRLSAIPGVFWAFLVLVVEGIWTRLSAIPGVFWAFFVITAESIWTALLGVPGMILGVFTSLAESITKALISIPEMIWKAITSWIPGIGGADTTGTSTGSTNRGRTRTISAAVADTI